MKKNLNMNQEFRLLIERYPEKNLPERIRKYATEVYAQLDVKVDNQDSVRLGNYKVGFEIDREKQILYCLLKEAEKYLKDVAIGDPNCIFFKKTDENRNQKIAFLNMIKEHEDWIYSLDDSDRKKYGSLLGEEYDKLYVLLKEQYNTIYQFQYFIFYCFCNGIRPLSALKGIYKKQLRVLKLLESISEDFTLEKIHCLFPSYSYPIDSKQRISSHYYNWDSNLPEEFKNYDFYIIDEKHNNDSAPTSNTYTVVNYGPKIPFNSNLLENPSGKGKLIFVTEYPQVAYALERQIIDNYVESLKHEIQMVADNHHTLYFGTEAKNKYIENRQLYFADSIRPTYKTPAGDCIWLAPVGGYHIPWYTDWKPLAGREVFVFKVGERNPQIYLKQLADVYDAILDSLEEKSANVKFVIFPEKVSANYKDNDIKILSDEELMLECEEHGIQVPETMMAYYSYVLRKKHLRRSSSFIVDPILRKNDWILLTGKEGVGKSWLAMALGLAIATNAKMMFPDWKVRKRALKVLYITDKEMTKDIMDDRIELLEHALRKRNNGLFHYVQKKECNLTKKKDRDELEKMIAEYTDIGERGTPVSVIILDHLLKLTEAQGDDKDNWPDFRKWLDTLTEKKNYSVILLHHEYEGTRMLGTRLISNDVGTRIHVEDYLEFLRGELEKTPKKERKGLQNEYDKLESMDSVIKMGVRIVKNRGGKKNARPLYLGLDTQNRVWCDAVEKSSDGTEDPGRVDWRRLSEDEKDELIIKEHKAGKKTSEIANMIGRSKETVGKRITQLISQGKLESKRHPKDSTAEASNSDNVDDPIQVGDNNGQIKL